MQFKINFLVYFLFLQLPEPLILFRFYNDFIGLAKESQNIIVDEVEASRVSPASLTPPQVSVELNRVLFKIKDLLRQLPPAHYKTLQFLIQHLHRYRIYSENLDELTSAHISDFHLNHLLISMGHFELSQRISRQNYNPINTHTQLQTHTSHKVTTQNCNSSNNEAEVHLHISSFLTPVG